MSEQPDDIVLEILKSLQHELSLVRRDQASQALRLLAMEDHQRGLLTSLHGVMTSILGVETDISAMKDRIDRIERRIGLMDTEH
ncbi:hypothetical protein HNO88_000399 [Novosphingobium chloroacetimidivorans]|uniref:Uncharacterized protein n=1 Tax=Novosphingobium chloroacetimidivorans TaxID=1428314 RepID=A0A7W7K6E7_9SPHN|nr:hypothetical protein [Novosphingobium chloroacetimidivorans]MBB4857102.1 hypothetical protein [Novosphingobium chloroacetimidivorans]